MERMARIMIVDCEPDIVYIVERILGAGGYDVVKASSGEECLEKLREELPDLVLLEAMLHGMDGWEACKRIKDHPTTKDLPVAMFTIRTSKEDVEKSFKYAHADAHINKPFERKELVDTVESLLG